MLCSCRLFWFIFLTNVKTKEEAIRKSQNVLSTSFSVLFLSRNKKVAIRNILHLSFRARNGQSKLKNNNKRTKKQQQVRY